MTIAGAPALAGVAWALPLGPGERLPEGVPSPAAWHVHRGTVDDEGALFGHHMAPAGEGAGFGVAMLHAWVWLENPDGPFAADNWALPFVRRGLRVPGVPPEELRAAALALSLPAEGGPFVVAQVGRHGSHGADGLDGARRVVAVSAAAVERWLGGGGGAGAVSGAAALARRSVGPLRGGPGRRGRWRPLNVILQPLQQSPPHGSRMVRAPRR